MTGPQNGNGETNGRDWGLTCAAFLELTTDYLEQALSPNDAARFEAHLTRCEGCSTILAQLRQQIALTGQLEEDDIDPTSLSTLLDAFSDWTERPRNDDR